MLSKKQFLNRRSALAVFAVLFSAAAAEAATIEWQVDNPFRFFKHQSDFEIHRWAYNELSAEEKRDNPVSKIERKLNNPQWWNTTDNRGRTRKAALAELRRAEGRTHVHHDPRLGWASLVRMTTYDMCWNAPRQAHRFCSSPMIELRSGTYLDPKGHQISMWVKDGGAQTCRWNSDQPIFPAATRGFLLVGATRPCNERVTAIMPAKSKVRITVEGDASGAGSDSIEVRDILIAGLGDSFSSGEGNPDVPVALDPSNGIAPGYDQQGSRTYKLDLGIPRRRSPGVPAEWIDRKCHRSIYSWQARTALGIALKEPQHQAVTFLSYACSGAEILEGMLYRYDGRETLDPARLPADGQRRLKWSQLDAVVDELCIQPSGNPQFVRPDVSLDARDEWVAKQGIPTDKVAIRTCPKDKMRPVDLVLLSIGGNDIGFSRIIANTVLQNGFTKGCGLFCYSRDTTRKYGDVVSLTDDSRGNPSAENRLNNHLPKRFSFLKAAFAERLKLPDNDQKRILFVAYPSPLIKNQQLPVTENLCRVGRASMTVSEVFEIKSSDTVKDVHNFVETKLIPKLVQYTSPWTWVDQHRKIFHGHAFCSETPGHPTESGQHSAEELGVAYTPFSLSEPWKLFNPANQLYPYESRTRWFRTFNDDYMITNYAKKRFEMLSPARDDTGRAAGYPHPANLIEQTLGGPMHPTAEGYSHMADAATIAARAILGLNQ